MENCNIWLRNYLIYKDYTSNHLTYDDISLKYGLSLEYIKNICTSGRSSAVEFEKEPASSLKRTCLSTRVINALSRIGIFTIEDLRAALTDHPEQIARLPHIGEKGLEECRMI